MTSVGQQTSKVTSVDVVPADPMSHQFKSATTPGDRLASSSSSPTGQHAEPVYLGGNDASANPAKAPEQSGMAGQPKKKVYFKYIRTKEFWFVLVLGQVLCVANTSSSTLSELLAGAGTSIPSFQSLLVYILLNLIYTSYTIYKYGFKKWFQLLYKDGWRYIILAFCDVEGNYFTVLAYRYTSILSCQLINFWAIVVVVLISLIFLRVRYHFFQYLGILICIGGTGVLLASDHITGSNGGYFSTALHGDLWALGGATFYGLDNVFQEFLVSKRPAYEVIGQLAFWATIIIGIQAAIFDRAAFQSASWTPDVGGYFVGYMLVLTVFYSLAPIMFRLSSAAFFNLSLLTGNFWGILIGIQVFHLHIHWMYPIALVLIIIGHVVYFCAESVLAEARKPWLGANQEKGVMGIGTARRQDQHGGLLGSGKSWGVFGKDEEPRRRKSVLTGAEGAGVV